MEQVTISLPTLQITELKIEETSTLRGTGSRSDSEDMENKH